MLWTLRHFLAVAFLPFTVTVIVPVWLSRRYGVSLAAGSSLPELALQAIGLGLLAVGAVLFATSLRRFITDGRGTLAPWDPPRRLVLRGPYRYVRNPMISGVVLVLFAEALLLGSRPHLLWTLAFVGINALYIPLLEERLLERRFGADYREYRRNVPRLLPRLRPWTDHSASSP